MLDYVKMCCYAVVHMHSNSHLYVKKTWFKILFPHPISPTKETC